MAEYSDYEPAEWAKRHDFKDARAHYDTHTKRSYDDATRAQKTLSDVLPESITTQSTKPLVIDTDQTGSMGDWTSIIFSKLPYLDHEVRTEYLGPDAEICFGAVGDTISTNPVEEYPVQFRPFATGKNLKERLDELVIEQKGGSQRHESYQTSALYACRKIHIPNAITPVYIIIGDEMAWGEVTVREAKKYLGIDLKQAISTKEIFAELMRKFSVYFIMKPYGQVRGERLNSESLEHLTYWCNLLGDDRVCVLSEAERVVDVIFGILGHETNKFDYFRKEIEGRQRPDQVATVYESLTTIHRGLIDEVSAGKSTIHGALGSRKGRKLLTD